MHVDYTNTFKLFIVFLPIPNSSEHSSPTKILQLTTLDSIFPAGQVPLHILVCPLNVIRSVFSVIPGIFLKFWTLTVFLPVLQLVQ